MRRSYGGDWAGRAEILKNGILWKIKCEQNRSPLVMYDGTIVESIDITMDVRGNKLAWFGSSALSFDQISICMTVYY